MTTLAITGGGGFLGHLVLETARSAGVRIVDIRRRLDVPTPSWDQRAADLRDPGQTHGVLDGVDVVIHLAAAKQGGFHDQYSSTVLATENLLGEARRAKVKRFVLVSSFAVYDYATIPPGSVLDESSPVDHSGRGRDAYAQTKVLQESVTRAWADANGVELVVARPGVVWSGKSWWTYRLGEQFGPFWLCFGNTSEVPLSYVDNCADALVHLSLVDVGAGTYNIFDDHPPSQRDYRRMAARSVSPKPLRVVLPWRAASGLAEVASRLNKRRAEPLRLPSFLEPESMAVRAKPLRYSSSKLSDTGWRQPIPTAQALQKAFAASP